MDFITKLGTREEPLVLKTPPLSSEYSVHIDQIAMNNIIVCTVGKTVLHYKIEAINDLHQLLIRHNDWMLLGSKDEKQDTAEGTVEHWARSSENPVGGWYGLKKNFRGRFAMYIPPILEHLGLAELEHNKRNNRMRGIPA